VRASGHRVVGRTGHHYFTFQALQAADIAFLKMAVYFDSARDIRNDFSYDAQVLVSDTDAEDLVKAVEDFQADVNAWIRSKDPTLI